MPAEATPPIPPVRFRIKDEALIVPNRVCLPPICALTGRRDVPLVEMKWSTQSGAIEWAAMSYFVSVPIVLEAQSQHARKLRVGDMAVGGMLLLLLVVGWVSTHSFWEGAGIALLVTLMLGLPVVKFMPPLRSLDVPNNIRVSGPSLLDSELTIRGLSPAVMQAMVEAGPYVPPPPPLPKRSSIHYQAGG